MTRYPFFLSIVDRMNFCYSSKRTVAEAASARTKKGT
jgi:hypothetical protein